MPHPGRLTSACLAAFSGDFKAFSSANLEHYVFFQWQAEQCVNIGGTYLLIESGLNKTLRHHRSHQSNVPASMSASLLNYFDANPFFCGHEYFGFCSPPACQPQADETRAWIHLFEAAFGIDRFVSAELPPLHLRVLSRLHTEEEVENVPDLPHLLEQSQKLQVRSTEPTIASDFGGTYEEQSQIVWEGRPANHSNPKRVAVLVVGLRDRFFPFPSLHHVVQPAVHAGFEVDYYAMLGLTAPNFHSYWYSPVPNPETVNLTNAELRQLLIEQGRKHGARRVAVILQPQDALIKYPPDDPLWQRWLGRGGRHDVGFQNFLRSRKQLEMLWAWITAKPTESGEYSHVLSLVDDLYWFHDLDLSNFHDPGVVYSTRLDSSLCHPGKKSNKEMLGVVLGGKVAGKYLSAYSEYYNNPDPTLDEATGTENYMELLTTFHGIPWEIVPNDQIPFFRGMYTMREGWDEPLLCMREPDRGEAPATKECIENFKHKGVVFCLDLPLH